MRGLVHMYVNKKNREINLLKAYITKIGYGNIMGYLIHTDRGSLKQEVLVCIRDSLSSYEKDVEDTDPFIASPCPSRAMRAAGQRLPLPQEQST